VRAGGPSKATVGVVRESAGGGGEGGGGGVVDGVGGAVKLEATLVQSLDCNDGVQALRRGLDCPSQPSESRAFSHTATLIAFQKKSSGAEMRAGRVGVARRGERVV
jgi:hypothetical protein